MTDCVQFYRVPSVRFHRRFQSTIARVWEHLVTPALLPGWYGASHIEPHVGGSISLMSGHIQGVITSCIFQRRLTYTWNVFAANENESQYPESYVSFELNNKEEQVSLVLTHLPVLERFEKQNAMGWHTFLDMLSASVQGEVPESRETYMKRNALLYGVDTLNLQS